MKRIKSFPLVSFEVDKWESIQFETAFEGLDQQRFKKALSYFKNPKSFFEKNERRLLGEELDANLQQPADEYLIEGKERIKTALWGAIRVSISTVTKTSNGTSRRIL